jgi:hypothetical protein
VLDCRGKDGIVDEVCIHTLDGEYDPGDTDIIIKWNECGIISFECSNINIIGNKYYPGAWKDDFPADLLYNGQWTGTCMPNWALVAIIAGGGIAVISTIAAIAVIIRNSSTARKITKIKGSKRSGKNTKN